ncbi:MAG: outer membrane beta-barrel protein [Gemmatimonadales bacterium]
MRVPLLAAAALVLAAPALAQVGTPPSQSPYRDLRYGHGISFLGAQYGGDGGEVAVGPHDGTTFGVRYDFRLSAPLAFGFSITRGDFDRVVIDPDEPPDERVPVPTTQAVTFFETALQFTVTGGKTWRRLAPYLEAGLGLAMGEDVPDPSGYEFGTKFYFAPAAGTRVFLGDHLFLRGEIRSTFWKLSYPDSFTDPFVENGVPDPEGAVLPGGPETEWVTSPSLHVGLGYSFSW